MRIQSMRDLLPLTKAAVALMLCSTSVGCANFIREADAVIIDAVPNTVLVGLDSSDVKGAVVSAKIRFTCQKQLFSVTNIYETAYGAEHEIYEIPFGLIGFVPSFLWYGVAELLSLGAADDSYSTRALNWSAAGFNPFLNVEYGMFKERYRIRKKPGSQRPQEGSAPEPYDAVVPPRDVLTVRFGDQGEAVRIPVDGEVGMTLNLIEAARVMSSPSIQKVNIEVKLIWNEEAQPVVKMVSIFIDAELAQKLYDLKDASAALSNGSDEAVVLALKAIRDAGFSREAAMAEDRLKVLRRAAD